MYTPYDQSYFVLLAVVRVTLRKQPSTIFAAYSASSNFSHKLGSIAAFWYLPLIANCAPQNVAVYTTTLSL